MFSLYLHKYFSELRTLSSMWRKSTFPVIPTIVWALAKSEHSWIYLGFSQNFALKFLDSIWWFDTFVWLLQLNFFLYMLQIRYHFITAKQEGCDPLDINLEKTAAWFGLCEQMQFLFKLCIELKQRDCNTCFSVILNIWKNVLFLWS